MGKNLGDDFFQRRVFDADVFQRVVREHGREHLRDLLAVDAKLHPRLGHFDDFAVAAQVVRQLAVAEQQRQHFVAAEVVDDAGERAVVHDLPWLMTTTRRQRAATSFM